MKRIIPCTIKTIYVLIFFCFGLFSSVGAQCLPNLGSASNFVLYTTTGAVSNVGTSFITGDVGTNAGEVTGFGSPSVLNGNVHIANSVTSQAAADLVAAYDQLDTMTPTNTTHAPAFGSETLFPGVYSIGGAGSVDGILTLDGQGNSNAIFAFKIGGAFTTGAGATIVLTNGARASNVIWIADGAVSMAASTTMSGTLIANGAISIADGGILYGRLLSTTGAIAIYNVNSQSQGVETSDAVGGIVSSNQAICSGYSPADLILTGNTGNVAQWEKSIDAAFTSPISIFSTATTLSGIIIGNLTTTTYFRARIQSTNCSLATSSYATITVGRSTTWNGISWSGGVPINTSAATISSNYSANINLTACSLKITNNAAVIIPSGHTVTLNGALTVDNGSSFTLNNNANLIQGGSTNTNSGIIGVKRASSALMRLDYTLWSSPVSGQNLLSFSPMTSSTRFYTYNSASNNFESIAPSNSTFAAAKGHLIRMPNIHPTTPTIWDGLFTGVPNNGNYSYTMYVGDATHRFNLVGNPYPSPIDAVKFVTDNRQIGSEKIKGTLYFWRKTNNANSPSYCSWSRAGGGNGTFVSNGEAQVNNLNGVIQTGQSFFVEAEASASVVNFTNSMRLRNTTGQFFRTTNPNTAPFESHRIWLNVTNAIGAFSQIAFGYMTDATQGLDAEIDSKFINDGPVELYSLVGNEKLVIQSRALPFNANDIVPLGFKATTAGDYSIAINHVDGVFTAAPHLFLKDLLSGIIHDLKLGAYSFASDAGTFNNRFEIMYTNFLGISQRRFEANNLVLYKSEELLVVNAGAVRMAEIEIFDSRGRLLVNQKALNTSETRLQVGCSHQVLLVNVTSVGGVVVIKKIVW